MSTQEWPVNAEAPPHASLAAALAAAQADMRNPAFDTTNPHFKSRFASLAAVRNAVIPMLAKHGIALVQDLTSTEIGIACTTILYHASGELRFGPLVIPVSKNDAQGFGSAATYARRYSMQAVAGVVGDDDDDGNAASAQKPARAVAPDVWIALADAANLGSAALREQWKQLSEDVRDAIMDGHGAKWEMQKSIAVSVDKGRK